MNAFCKASPPTVADKTYRHDPRTLSRRCLLPSPRRVPVPVLALVLICCLAAGAGCDARRAATFGGETMGTVYSVTIADAGDDADVARLARTVKAELDAVNARMSTYLEDSELSRFNRSRSTDWQPASAQLVAVLSEALRVSALSDGAFDVTVGPVVNLWGFGPGPEINETPSPEAIEHALSIVGYRRLEVRPSPPMIRKRIPQLYVDLSAIAKGYAVDRVAAALTAEGTRDFLIDVGGELYASGVNARGEPWRVGIEAPAEQTRSALRSIQVSDAAVATSGDYRIYVEIEGRRYSHQINPRTARPVTHRTALVSVVAPNAMEADALATALLVLGSEAGLELARRRDIAAYFVNRGAEGFVATASPVFAARFGNGG